MVGRVLQATMLVALISLAGCAQRAVLDERPTLDNCCVNADPAPRWVVAIAEQFAPVVGQTIGRIAWRRGYLDETDAQNVVMPRLQPLDIILEGSKGRLSGNTIPGKFSHTAAYVGGERELRALGIWNHPTVRPHQDTIRNGARFIEADNKGVHLSQPRTVFNTDNMVVIRPVVSTANWRRRSALRLFERLGEPFDFHFDASTPDVAFCVELICEAIPELRLPRQMVSGRPTIIPDVVGVEMLRGNRRLRYVMYVRGSPEGYELGTREQLANDIAVAWTPERRQPPPPVYEAGMP